MSWCRFGSPCQGTIPAFEDDKACPLETCPGSSLYIFEDVAGGYECCSCPFGRTYHADTEEQMLDHIEEHVKAGHHVRPSMRRGAPRKLTQEWQDLQDEWDRSTSAQPERSAKGEP